MNYLYLSEPVHKNIFNLDKIEGLVIDDLLISFDGTIMGINEKRAVKGSFITNIKTGYEKIPDTMISGDINNAKDFYTFLSIIGFE